MSCLCIPVSIHNTITIGTTYCVKQSKNESKKKGWKEEEPVECATLCPHNVVKGGVDCMLQQREVTEPPISLI